MYVFIKFILFGSVVLSQSSDYNRNTNTINVLWFEKCSVDSAEGHGANEKLKSTIEPGMEHPFPRVKVELRTAKGIWLIRVLPKVSGGSSPLHVPTLIITLQLIPPFVFYYIFQRPQSPVVRTWSPFRFALIFLELRLLLLHQW